MSGDYRGYDYGRGSDYEEGGLGSKIKSALEEKGITPGRILSTGIVLGGLIAALANIHVVGPKEQGVITRFGMYNRTVEPGLVLTVPVLESLVKEDVQTYQRVEIGYRTVREAKHGESAEYEDALNNEEMRNEAQMLTADGNILWVSATIQYKIDDITKYLYNIADPEQTVQQVGQAALRQTVGDYGVDEVLTFGRSEIEANVKEQAQELLDLYDSGIKIMQVNLQNTQPPNLTGTDGARTVSDAFRGVESATQAKETKINEAIAYENQVTTEAEGIASQTIAEAEGFKATRIGQAQFDVSEYSRLYDQYLLDPAGTRYRLYVETLEKILPYMDKTMIDSQLIGGGTLNLLDLNGGN